MKPILIDAIYINTGGALTVLNHLVDSVTNVGVEIVLLKDVRCPILRNEDKVNSVVILHPSLKARHLYYKEHRCDFYSILCLGNVPPTLKMPCKVYTYFHNLSTLVTPPTYSAKRKFLFWIKKQVIKLCSKNTDSWIVQTSNTENILRNVLGKDITINIYPIYTLPKFDNNIQNKARTDYLFIGDYTFSKGHDVLLDAWEKLHNMGKDFTLHLTIGRKPSIDFFCTKMDNLIKNNVNIINHGFVPFEEACKLYSLSKAIVYPSLTESLGLGIVEGISAGCDVITADLPYAHSICKPSEVFNPIDSDSIVKAILRYEAGNSPKSELTIHDCVNDLINLIYT